MAIDRKRGKSRTQTTNNAGKEYPTQKKKDSCIYMDGVVDHTCKGLHKVKLDNNMLAVCTSTKLDHKRIGVMIGDKVTVEIPALALSTESNLKGRIIWRYRPNR